MPHPSPTNRRIRVFVSSTFRDMIADRNELMTHAWPELRRFCRERHVELVEVDLRWGIAEVQSARKETLKLCLDEIRDCRPFFIGMLGERYGYVPGDDAFTADLKEEQPWLRDFHDRSVTELEILHGVLNNPEMAGRAFFYFRDPRFVDSVPLDKKANFIAEDAESATKQQQLKALIRTTCVEKEIPLHENYSDPRQLAVFVLADLRAAIEAQFPNENIPDALAREAQDHQAFAEIRRRTYIGRPDYFDALDRHATGDGGPLVLVGDSGAGKSALLANWLAHWREQHPKDFIVQHYIGGTPDSADHWRLMMRVSAEIKRWSGEPADLPRTHDDLRKDFPLWLAKARAKAQHEGVRFVLVLDALNQLEDHDHARLLGWLPEHPFSGPLRLIASTPPSQSGTDDPLEAIWKRHWLELHVHPLTVDERRRMISTYLARYGKKLDDHRLDRLAMAAPTATPLYLKILLDDLRVTGTHSQLDQRLTDYLAGADIPALLQQVMARYQRDYEGGRSGLVAETLGLIYAARRGLSETELLHLLRPVEHPQLPPAMWAPLRAALEDSLVNRGGVLNFAHDFLRTAVEAAFVANEGKRDELRRQLTDYFAQQPVASRSCDELPWLLFKTESFARLHTCLLEIDRFLEIDERDQDELMRYWVGLGEERTMGRAYLDSFEQWSRLPGSDEAQILHVTSRLAVFLQAAALHAEAEIFSRRALTISEERLGAEHPLIADGLNNLAQLLQATSRLTEAEQMMRRVITIRERDVASDPLKIASSLHNLAHLLRITSRPSEAEPLMRQALDIFEREFGPDHPDVANSLNILSQLLKFTNRPAEAEPLARRALAIYENNLGEWHPNVARVLNNLAHLFQVTNRLQEAETLMRRALAIDEQNLGPKHPYVAKDLNDLAQLLYAVRRLVEAEPLLRRALIIDEETLGPEHPEVATNLNNLAAVLRTTNRLAEAEPLMRRALAIDESSFGPKHPTVATRLNNLADLLLATHRLSEAEPLLQRAVAILDDYQKNTGHEHPAYQSISRGSSTTRKIRVGSYGCVGFVLLVVIAAGTLIIRGCWR
jgi:tetratricopeptide (TPR) repeat protein